MRNQVFKKLFSVLLTLIMVAGLLPASVLAEGEGNCQESHSLQIVQSHGLHIEPNPAWGHCPGDSTF